MIKPFAKYHEKFQENRKKSKNGKSSTKIIKKLHVYIDFSTMILWNSIVWGRHPNLYNSIFLSLSIIWWTLINLSITFENSQIFYQNSHKIRKFSMIFKMFFGVLRLRPPHPLRADPRLKPSQVELTSTRTIHAGANVL